MNSNDDSCDINEISCLGNSKISIQVVDYNFGKFVKTYEQYVTKKGTGSLYIISIITDKKILYFSLKSGIRNGN